MRPYPPSHSRPRLVFSGARPEELSSKKATVEAGERPQRPPLSHPHHPNDFQAKPQLRAAISSFGNNVLFTTATTSPLKWLQDFVCLI